ncbi:MAG: hypothetical protein IJM50_05870 [Lachnospiraceae bacterium]|nr:hypothetical protein [Lachnospiraceae bacterium]
MKAYESKTGHCIVAGVLFVILMAAAWLLFHDRFVIKKLFENGMYLLVLLLLLLLLFVNALINAGEKSSKQGERSTPS